jgi:segregation and condensation protein A
VVRVLPELTLRELLIAFKDVAIRADMFAHHHIQREPLSVRARMSDILAVLRPDVFTDFIELFQAQEGRMGVAVTFVAILELLREGLIDIVQRDTYGPLHVRAGEPAQPGRTLDARAEEASAADARLLASAPVDDSDDEPDPQPEAQA